MTDARSPRINRRQMAEGAIWSAPVILMTANAPVYAASIMCTTVATSFGGAWVYQNPASGTLFSPSSNKVYQGTDGVGYYAAVTTATSSSPAVIRATGTVNAVSGPGTTALRAGCTYSVSYGLTAVPNSQGKPGHQVLVLKLVDPSGVVVPGSQKTFTTATGVTGQTNVPYTTTSNLRRTLAAPAFTFTAKSGTYKVVGEFTTPTNKTDSSIYATGLGFASPRFTAV